MSCLVFVVAAGGAVSFRKLGMLHRLPDQWQGPIKTVHRNVCPYQHSAAQLHTLPAVSGHLLKFCTGKIEIPLHISCQPLHACDCALWATPAWPQV